MKKQADLILHSGQFYTVNSNSDIVEAIAVQDGKIIDLGTSERILERYTGESIDLNGLHAYPGFIDPHCHLLHYGRSFYEIDLFGCSSYDELLKRLIAFDKTGLEWIVGRGWDQNLWDLKEYPTKEKLDSLFPDIPVYLTRIDGHAALVNSYAIEKCGLLPSRKVKGGEFILKDGELSGILIDNAMSLVRDEIPYTEEEKRKFVNSAQQDLFKYGLTTLGDAWVEYDDFDLYKNMQESGQLKLRIYCMLAPEEENKNFFSSNGIYKDDRLNARAFKYFLDGALGSRGAALLKDYSDDPGNRGLMMNTKEYFSDEAKWCLEHSFQMNTHAIGDSANRMILNIYAQTLDLKNDFRWRVEHVQVIHPDDLEKIEKYSIVPSIQTTHATSDMPWAHERLGNRVEHAYNAKTLLNKAGLILNGSDFPIEKANPLFGFYSAVSRKDLSGSPTEGFKMQESLSREEALKAMTIWAAYGQFEEDEKGSIEIGKWADITITDTDIMECEEERIHKTKVIYTILNGEVVFRR